MNVLDTVRAERPDVAPLDPATRAALRERVVGTAAWARRRQPGAAASTRSHRSRRRRPRLRGSWLTVAAILIVGLGLAAVIVTAGRPWSMPPAAPPVHHRRSRPALPVGHRAGRRVDARPARDRRHRPAGHRRVGGDDRGARARRSRRWRSPRPPAGYELESATYVPGNGQWGMATYVTDSSTTQIWLLVTSSRTWFDSAARPGADHLAGRRRDRLRRRRGCGRMPRRRLLDRLGVGRRDLREPQVGRAERGHARPATHATHGGATMLDTRASGLNAPDVWPFDDPATLATTGLVRRHRGAAADLAHGSGGGRDVRGDVDRSGRHRSAAAWSTPDGIAPDRRRAARAARARRRTGSR